MRTWRDTKKSSTRKGKGKKDEAEASSVRRFWAGTLDNEEDPEFDMAAGYAAGTHFHIGGDSSEASGEAGRPPAISDVGDDSEEGHYPLAAGYPCGDGEVEDHAADAAAGFWWCTLCDRSTPVMFEEV